MLGVFFVLWGGVFVFRASARFFWRVFFFSKVNHTETGNSRSVRKSSLRLGFLLKDPFCMAPCGDIGFAHYLCLKKFGVSASLWLRLVDQKGIQSSASPPVPRGGTPQPGIPMCRALDLPVKQNRVTMRCGSAQCGAPRVARRETRRAIWRGGDVGRPMATCAYGRVMHYRRSNALSPEGLACANQTGGRKREPEAGRRSAAGSAGSPGGHMPVVS